MCSKLTVEVPPNSKQRINAKLVSQLTWLFQSGNEVHSYTFPFVGGRGSTDRDLSDIGAWSQWGDREGGAQACCAGCDQFSIVHSVVDLIKDDESIRLLRGTPGEHYGG